MSKDIVEIGLFDPTKKVESIGQKTGKTPADFAPGGTLLHRTMLPVFLAKSLFDHLYLIHYAKEAGKDWFSGTEFWQAVRDHFRSCKKPNKCLVEMKIEHEYSPFIKDVDFWKKYSTHSDDPKEQTGKDFIRVYFTAFGGEHDICIPLKLVENFTKKAFDEWVKSVAEIRVKSKKKTSAHHRLRTLLHSGDLTIKEIEDEINEFKSENETNY